MIYTKFLTYTGKVIDFTNIREEDICLEDIAHHLTQEYRFGGSLELEQKYSVASHSLHCYVVAKMLYPNDYDLHKAILLHDAAEAYLKDIPTGLKACLKDYKKLEQIIEDIISNKYDAPIQRYKKDIKEIDGRMFATEVYCFVKNTQKFNYYKAQIKDPYINIRVLPDKYPHLIKQLFLGTCKELGIED